MKLLKKLLESFERKRIRRLPRLYQGAAWFCLKYHDKYSYGFGSYGLPVVEDWDEGATLKIGSYCSIAMGAKIFLGGHHRADWISTYPFPAKVEEAEHIVDYGVSRGDVIIGSDVWLCSNSMILSGVTVGHGAVVAAGAVVARDVAPYSIVAGNPARHVRWRFDEETRKVLLAIAWWDWPEQEVRKISPLLCSGNVQGLLDYAEKRKNPGVCS